MQAHTMYVMLRELMLDAMGAHGMRAHVGCYGAHAMGAHDMRAHA